uniref:Uncharacterized protein n=1 Tax=Rhizophora mucronata TaxID=61149 RepID=A0A2P2QY54_RHIMU
MHETWMQCWKISMVLTVSASVFLMAHICNLFWIPPH